MCVIELNVDNWEVKVDRLDVGGGIEVKYFSGASR